MNPGLRIIIIFLFFAHFNGVAQTKLPEFEATTIALNSPELKKKFTVSTVIRLETAKLAEYLKKKTICFLSAAA